MENNEITIHFILQNLTQFKEQCQLPGLLKGKVKSTFTFSKNLNTLTEKRFLVEFSDSLEKEHYQKICLFNQKLVDFAESNSIDYKLLQYRYKLGDNYLPMVQIKSIQDGSDVICQSEENKFLFLLVCEIKPFQPNANFDYLRAKLNEISALIKGSKSVVFKVVFIESYTNNLSNKEYFSRFSPNLDFPSKIKAFVEDHKLENINFNYISTPTGKKNKTLTEFHLAKEKLPYLLLVDSNTKIIYEGEFHTVDFNRTIRSLEKNSPFVSFVDPDTVKELTLKMEGYRALLKRENQKNIDKAQYSALKNVLQKEFGEQFQGMTFNFPFSYINEVFMLEKVYEFEDMKINKTYKQALVNNFYTKNLTKYYFGFKTMLKEKGLGDCLIDLSHSDSRKISCHSVMHYCSKYFKKDLMFQMTVDKSCNSLRLINTTDAKEFSGKKKELCKLFLQLGFHFLTSPKLNFINLFPCLKIGDQCQNICLLESISDNKAEMTVKFSEQDFSVVLFAPHNLFSNKDCYEKKLTRLKEVLKISLESSFPTIKVIFFNTPKDYGFSEKIKNQLSQKFLALVSPNKNFQFFFVDCVGHPEALYEYMIYFSNLNTLKAVIVDKSHKLIYNGSVFHEWFSQLTSLLYQKQFEGVSKLVGKISKMIPAQEFLLYKETLDILSDEASLYIERVLEETEISIKYLKHRTFLASKETVTETEKCYTIPRIRVCITLEERKKLLEYFKTEIYSKLDSETIYLELQIKK